MHRIFHSPPHLSGFEQQAVMDAFGQNWIAPCGPQVDAFEANIASFVGASGALATCSGTAALHLALRLLDVGSGDTVFCSSFTWIASIAPAIYLGAEPVFIDSDTETWNMCPDALQRAFEDASAQGKLPKAVIVVHVFGQSASMDPILSLCNAYQVPVVEDAAESLGATYSGRYSGTIGRFGIYSFNGNKIITTSSGGALVSNDTDALQRARYLATHARLPVRHHEHHEIGYNYRMSSICAAIGLGQMRVLRDHIAARRAVYFEYYSRLKDLPGVQFMPDPPTDCATHWMTALTVDPALSSVHNVDLMEALAAADIEPRPVWMPQHLQPVMRGFRYYSHRKGEDVSARLFHTGLCLPSGSSLTPQDMERVVACVREQFANAS